MKTDRRTVSTVVEADLRRAVMPPAPPEVVAALIAGLKSSRLLLPQDGSVKTIEVWEPPAVADKRTGMAIWSRLEELEEFTAPAEPGQIMSRVLVLLSHYRQAGHSDAVEQGIADDWAEDLECYPMWAINDAVRQWRRTRKFKPQITEIIELCDQASGEVLKELSRLRSILAATKALQNSLVGNTQAFARTMLKVVA